MGVFQLLVLSVVCSIYSVASMDRLLEQGLRDMLLLKDSPRRDCRDSLTRRIADLNRSDSYEPSQNKCIPGFIRDQTELIMQEKVRFIKKKTKLTGRAARKVTGQVFPALADNLKTVALQLEMVSKGDRQWEL